ncbi:MAG: hypothetical protein ABJA82_09570 [Myxococcales bacterium]
MWLRKAPVEIRVVEHRERRRGEGIDNRISGGPALHRQHRRTGAQRPPRKAADQRGTGRRAGHSSTLGMVMGTPIENAVTVL